MVAEQEIVLKITDKTDLDKEAYFDINAFIAKRGLLKNSPWSTSSSSSSGKVEEIPSFILENSMTELFTVPQETHISDQGIALL